MDGGVKADWTAQESVRAGATILVAGERHFQQERNCTGGDAGNAGVPGGAGLAGLV